ncbi:MAG: DUF3592 domain-containing protein [Planctomycetales bacterium]|nr:DUF3592 domain-containing protein [Planctomycetales bacterium]
MKHSTRNRRPSLIYVIAFALISVTAWGVALLIAKEDFHRRTLAESSRRWPTATGQVTEDGKVHLHTVSDDDLGKRIATRSGRPVGRVTIKYTYRVNGRDYEGSMYNVNNLILHPQLRRLPRAEPLDASAVSLGSSFRRGATIAVYYDPKNPAQSLLRPNSEYINTGFPSALALALAATLTLVTVGPIVKWRGTR